MAQDNALKDVLKSVSDFGVLVSDLKSGASLQDLNDLVALAQDIPVVISDGPALQAQYVALDDAGRADLDQYIGSLPNFPANAKVDGIAKKVLDCGVALSVLIQAIVA